MVTLVLLYSDIKPWIVTNIDAFGALFLDAFGAVLEALFAFAVVLLVTFLMGVPGMGNIAFLIFQHVVSPLGTVLWFVGIFLLVILAVYVILTACRNLKVFVEVVGGKAYQMAVNKGRELVEPAKEKLSEFAELVKFAAYFFAGLSTVALVTTVFRFFPKESVLVFKIFAVLFTLTAAYQMWGNSENKWKFCAVNVLVTVSGFVLNLHKV